MEYVGLADCNSFYASCERVFRPDLRGKPIVVLSNNDGCIVALSKEAKEAGITRGIPYFKAKELLAQTGACVFSSNYTLYQDFSDRVSDLLSSFTTSCEKYSIDESFFCIGNVSTDYAKDYSEKLAKYLIQGIGIPVSIGMARTKTLAKIANHIAKKKNLHYVLTQQEEEEVLKSTSIDDIWGLGWRGTAKAVKMGMKTAWDFANCDMDFILKNFTVCGYRTAQELKGVKMIGRENPANLSVSSSISFATPCSDFNELKTALACHCSTVCFKLHASGFEAKQFGICLLTNKFDPDFSYSYAFASCDRQTGYLPSVIQLLTPLLQKLYVKDRRYKSVRVIAADLHRKQDFEVSLFDSEENLNLLKRQQAMTDLIFSEEGISCASSNFKKKRDLANSQLLSPFYTTRWSDLPHCS